MVQAHNSTECRAGSRAQLHAYPEYQPHWLSWFGQRADAPIRHAMAWGRVWALCDGPLHAGCDAAWTGAAEACNYLLAAFELESVRCSCHAIDARTAVIPIKFPTRSA